MANIQYKGLTFYIKNEKDILDKLRLLDDIVILSQAEQPLHSQLQDDPAEHIAEKYDFMTQEGGIGETISNHVGMLNGKDFEMPDNTPERYQKPAVKQVQIGRQNMFYIYVPIVAKHGVHHMEADIIRIMRHMFHIMSIKTKEGDESSDFHSLETQIMQSVRQS